MIAINAWFSVIPFPSKCAEQPKRHKSTAGVTKTQRLDSI